MGLLGRSKVVNLILVEKEGAISMKKNVLVSMFFRSGLLNMLIRNHVFERQKCGIVLCACAFLVGVLACLMRLTTRT